MAGKKRSNKEILKELIDKIQEIKRISQGRISVLSGYETENYLSEAKSTNKVTDNIIKAVSALYEKAKINPKILDEPIISHTGTPEELFSNQTASLDSLNNTIKVIRAKMIELEVKVTGRSIAEVTLEFDKLASGELELDYVLRSK